MALRVIQIKDGNSSANSSTVNLTVNSTTGSNLIVVAVMNDNARSIVSVRDGKNTYIQSSASLSIGNGGNFINQFYYLTSGSGARTNITASFNGSAGTYFKELFAIELEGFTNATFDSASATNAAVENGVTASGAPINMTPGATNGFAAASVITFTAIGNNPLTGNEFTAGGLIGTTFDAICALTTSVAGFHKAEWADTGGGVAYAASTIAFREGTVVTGSNVVKDNSSLLMFFQ